jgi:DNA-binding NarL/FixJ family response regulator
MPIKVLLADDSKIMRRAIRSLLETQPGVKLEGEAADFAQTIQMGNDLRPQVIVMDLHMSDETKAELPNLKSLLNHGSLLLAISFGHDEDVKALAESFGAVTFLDKADLGNKLIPTILQLALPSAGAGTSA